MKNIWVSDHEVGHLAGCDVLFALDVWEHAYLLDYLPAQRADYVAAVFTNLKWSAVETRYAM
jgi:Fe-Mn family superoxide dismutase